MAIVRMTAKEMREKYPLTSERIKELELLSQNEPDLSDPDNPELNEEFWKKAHRPVFVDELVGREMEASV